MLIAQITDVHLGFEPDQPRERNRVRLDQTIAALIALKPQPDVLLVTGDLADAGDDMVSYRALESALAPCPFPVWFCMGNHDSRAPFRECFPHVPTADDFVQYAIDDYPLRILVLDTLDVGRHSGGFCEARAIWLADRLAEQPDRPTLLVLHHPPVATGLSWMTEKPEAEWIERLRPIVEAYSNIVGLIGGHLHRPVVMRWAGTMLVVCPSTAPQLALDLDTIDPDQPDGRAMIVEDPPGYAIHYWDGGQLITHFDTAQEHPVLASYQPALQPLVQKLVSERQES